MTTIDFESANRKAKARSLADTFFADCRGRLANMAVLAGEKKTATDATIIAKAAEGTSRAVWLMMAKRAGIRTPSDATIDLAIRYLQYRADPQTGENPFDGFPACL